MKYRSSTDIPSHRKPSATKIFCGNKPIDGCVREPSLQASWFTELGLGAIAHGHWGVTAVVHSICDFSVFSVVAKGGSKPILKLVF